MLPDTFLGQHLRRGKLGGHLHPGLLSTPLVHFGIVSLDTPEPGSTFLPDCLRFSALALCVFTPAESPDWPLSNE